MYTSEDKSLRNVQLHRARLFGTTHLLQFSLGTPDYSTRLLKHFSQIAGELLSFPLPLSGTLLIRFCSRLFRCFGVLLLLVLHVAVFEVIEFAQGCSHASTQ
jgi:hypothetical protein